jgi:hypothetical protein
MRKAAKVLAIYLLILFSISILLSWFHLTSFFIPFIAPSIEVRTIMIFTIIGGIWALKLTVKPYSLKIFLFAYAGLWLLRFAVLYVANNVGEVYLFSRPFRFDLIVGNYYSTVSRLETPLPFVIFWLINYFFSEHQKPPQANKSGI